MTLALRAELLTRDEEASQRSPVGPVFTWYARIYGRDVTDPLPANLTMAAINILSALVERLEGAVVKRGEASPPRDAQEEHVNISKYISHFRLAPRVSEMRKPPGPQTRVGPEGRGEARGGGGFKCAQCTCTPSMCLSSAKISQSEQPPHGVSASLLTCIPSSIAVGVWE